MKTTGPPLTEKLRMGAVVLTVTGRWEICVENYRFLRSLTEQQIQIQARDCRVTIRGKGLFLVCYTREFMVIHGCIEGIEYQE